MESSSRKPDVQEYNEVSLPVKLALLQLRLRASQARGGARATRTL